MENVTQILTEISAMEVPIPDFLLVGLFTALLIIIAYLRGQRHKAELKKVSAVYQTELMRVSRNLHTAEQRLSATRGELDKLRRTARREASARRRL